MMVVERWALADDGAVTEESYGRHYGKGWLDRVRVLEDGEVALTEEDVRGSAFVHEEYAKVCQAEFRQNNLDAAARYRALLPAEPVGPPTAEEWETIVRDVITRSSPWPETCHRLSALLARADAAKGGA